MGGILGREEEDEDFLEKKGGDREKKKVKRPLTKRMAEKGGIETRKALWSRSRGKKKKNGATGPARVFDYRGERMFPGGETQAGRRKKETVKRAKKRDNFQERSWRGKGGRCILQCLKGEKICAPRKKKGDKGEGGGK